MVYWLLLLEWSYRVKYFFGQFSVLRKKYSGANGVGEVGEWSSEGASL